MRHLERFFQHCLHMRDCIQSTNGLLLLVSDYKICITGAHYRIQAHIKVDFFASFSHIFSCFKKSIFRFQTKKWRLMMYFQIGMRMTSLDCSFYLCQEMENQEGKRKKWGENRSRDSLHHHLQEKKRRTSFIHSK